MDAPPVRATRRYSRRSRAAVRPLGSSFAGGWTTTTSSALRVASVWRTASRAPGVDAMFRDQRERTAGRPVAGEEKAPAGPDPEHSLTRGRGARPLARA